MGRATYLNKPHCAVASDKPVCQQPDDGEIHLTEEEEEGEHAHDMDIHAMDLHDPKACGMGVLNAPGLVILQCFFTHLSLRRTTRTETAQSYLQAVEEPWVQGVGDELVDAGVAEAEDGQGRPLAPAVDLEAHEDCLLARAHVHVGHVECPKRIEDGADSDHPCQDQGYGVALVIEELPAQPHGALLFTSSACIFAGIRCQGKYILCKPTALAYHLKT